MGQLLYDKASLVNIPSRYRDGKLYNIKPSNADFEFERGTQATRVNEDGLIEGTPSNGIELVTNGGFDTDSDWNIIGDGSISNNKAELNVSSGAFVALYQNISFKSGSTYRVSFNLQSNLDDKQIQVRDHTSSGNPGGLAQVVETSSVRTDTHTITFTANSNSDSIYFKRNSSTGDYFFSIDDVSVQELNLDTPRIDYTNGKALLLEPQRTNLFPDSVGYIGMTYLGTSHEFVSIASPDGTTNGVKRVTATTTSQARMEESVFPSTLDTNYTWSIFVKKDTARYVGLSHFSENSNKVIFDLDNGAIVSEGGSLPAKIESFSNGWYRISKGAYLPSGMSSSGFKVHLSTVGSAFTSVIGESAFVYGFQIEQGSYATSYIPTNGGTETRLADVCQGGGDESTFNDSEGVLYAEIAALADDLTFRTVSISDGTTDNRVDIRYRTTSNAINGLISGNGSIAFNNNHVTQDIKEFSKVALKYKSGNIALWVDGVEVLSSTASFNITGLNTISFNRGTSIDLLYGKVKSLAYFPEALEDHELERLTSPTPLHASSFEDLANNNGYTIL